MATLAERVAFLEGAVASLEAESRVAATQRAIMQNYLGLMRFAVPSLLGVAGIIIGILVRR